jgi:hypothetical protein
MSAHKHDVENQGANPRDHLHLRHHIIRHARRHWKVLLVVCLMLFSMLIYEVSDNLSLRPGKHALQPTPEAVAP